MIDIKHNLELLITKLYNSALTGDVPSLLKLLEQDPDILDQCSIEKSSRFNRSPLHVATNLGHLNYVAKILSIKPAMAEEVDYRKQSALHLSASNGHLEIVRVLLKMSPNMCLARDEQGRNPVHVAAMKGRVEVLELLCMACLQAAYERTGASETVLHLCVKYDQVKALECLMKVTNNGELLNAIDSVGNTVLHLAVEANNFEMVQVLLKMKIEKDKMNANKMIAMDLIREKEEKNCTETKILKYLECNNALRAKEAKKKEQKNPREWSEKHHDALIVVASLIATLAFQVGVSPPGGTWQDFQEQHLYNGRFINGIPGTSIYADIYPHPFKHMEISNGIALVSSLSVILLLLSRIQYHKYFPHVLMVIMCVALSATTTTYMLAAFFVSHKEYRVKARTSKMIIEKVWQYAGAAWFLFLMCILLDQVIIFVQSVRKCIVHKCKYYYGVRP